MIFCLRYRRAGQLYTERFETALQRALFLIGWSAYVEQWDDDGSDARGPLSQTSRTGSTAANHEVTP